MKTDVQTQIYETAEEIRRQAFLRCEEEKQNDDLVELYQELLKETEKHEHSGLLLEFTTLLQKEINLFSPHQAYLYGVHASQDSAQGTEYSYFADVLSQPEATRLQKKIQEKFDRLCLLLGKKRGLLSEFTECYRDIFGAVAKNIHVFINLGISHAQKVNL